ncbi:MAG: type I DNA topoisomerase [Aureispira sp.]|nr:type I DNA topoisomerase [Aureispira sp.]
MSKNLLIVESPAKAKTIEKYLGKDFTVKSSFGHIRDLAKDSKDKKAIDIDNSYKPRYEVSSDKRKVVKELKDWVKKVDHVWLATDEDREGEAISWHLAKVLGLSVDSTKRIVFREITKPALQKAIQSPRTIDTDLVNAQQTRRILDRLIGFELSPLLWKKIKPSLSAGRVQSVAVKLVVDKERQINEFEAKSFFRIAANYLVKNERGRLVTLKAKLTPSSSSSKKKFELEGDAKAFLQKCIPANYKVSNIKVRPTKSSPSVPFTTSTLQQEASRKLYFPVAKTMRVAQRLYEAGHITYMRTDSVSLSDTALQNIEQVVKTNYGANYYKLRKGKNKKGAQEAHEAIRPTNFENTQVSGDRDQQRLYELIWKRTVASQMADAQYEKTTIDIDISTVSDANFVAEGKVLKFDGYLKVYLAAKEDDEDEDDGSSDGDTILPPMKVGQPLDLKDMAATQRFTSPPARFSEASLVKKLEELGIGRPSTYAPTISKIMDPTRGYVTKETRDGKKREYKVLSLDAAQLNDANPIQEQTKTEMAGAVKGKLFASDLGMQVTDFLSEYFADIMNYRFTADIEDKLDKIAHGKIGWVDTLDKVYKPFHEIVEDTLENADRVTGERILGKDPKTGRTVLVRIGRFGPIAQIGATDELAEEEKPQYANLHTDQSIETIKLEEALELFQFPKSLGEFEGKDIALGEGRYGPYIKYDGAYISIPKDVDPFSIGAEKAIALIKAKQKADAPIGYYDEKPITKGAGRFGPFVKWEKLYVSITKKSGYQLDTITEAQAIELIKAKQEKEANRYIHQWPEIKVAVENGRWGPFIRLVKKSYKLLNADGKKMTPEEAKEVTQEQVIKLIEEQGGKVKMPKAKKKKAPAKKKTTKK